MRPHFRTTFVITTLAWFVFAVDRLVVLTMLPVLSDELGASAEQLAWTVDAFTLTFAVLLPTGAALGDRFGRRRVFVAGVAVFTLGSALAALAPTASALVAARAVQGLGGALYVPVTMTILVGATPPARRGAALGLWGGLGSVGAAAGPVVGGALTQAAGWQAVFWLVVPLGAVAAVAGHRYLAESHGPHGRLDLPGIALSSTGLLGLVWGVIRGGTAGWTHPTVLLALAGGALALAGFVAWERRAPAPMVSVRLFAARRFGTANLASLLFYAGAFGVLFLLAPLLQRGLGATPWEAGLRTLPLAIAPVLLAPVGGLLGDRFGTRPVLLLAAVLETVGLVWFAAFAAVAAGGTVGYGALVPALVLIGSGTALFFAPVSAASLAAVPPGQHGAASGTATAVREVGIVLGVAVLGTVFGHRAGDGTGAPVAAAAAGTATLGAALAAAAVLVALTMPRSRTGAAPRRTAAAPAARDAQLVGCSTKS